jgi:hypothetical protein
MKRIAILACTLGMLMVLGTAVAAETPVASTAAVPQTLKKQTLCPIMADNPINKNLFVDYDGKRIYVCCRGCIGVVKKDPAKYIALLEKEGITLDKVPVASPAK